MKINDYQAFYKKFGSTEEDLSVSIFFIKKQRLFKFLTAYVSGPAELWQAESFCAFPKKYRNNREIALEAVSKHPECFNYLEKECKKDVDFCLRVVKNNYACFKYLDKKRKSFIFEQLKNEKAFLDYLRNSLNQEIKKANEAKIKNELPISQAWLTRRIHAKGYSFSKQGMCFGISTMAAQAFVADDFDRFLHRLAVINQIDEGILAFALYLPQAYTESDSKEDITLAEIHAFFDGVCLYQGSNNYAELFAKQKTLRQEQCDAASLVRPLIMEQMHAELPTGNDFYGVYTLESLIKYFMILEETITAPVSMVLAAKAHAINIQYFPENKIWRVFDPNHLSDYRCDGIDDVVFKIWQTESFEQDGTADFNTAFFSVPQNQEQLKKQVDELKDYEPELFDELSNTQKIKRHVFANDLDKIEHFYAEKEQYSFDKAVKKGRLIHHAIAQGNIKIADFIIDHTTKLNTTDDDGQTPLILAAIYDEYQLLEKLIANGAKLHKIDNDDIGLMTICLMKKNIQLLEFCLDRGLNVNQVDDTQFPIEVAILNNRIDLVECLLNHGADINALNSLGYPTLMLALDFSDSKMVELILGCQPNVNIKAEDGTTALHLAVFDKDAEAICQKLIDLGADPNLTDDEGMTPLTALVNNDKKNDSYNPNVVKLLLKAGAIFDKDSHQAKQYTINNLVELDTPSIKSNQQNQRFFQKPLNIHNLSKLEEKQMSEQHVGSEVSSDKVRLSGRDSS
jgi:ankyrin repeat protein